MGRKATLTPEERIAKKKEAARKWRQAHKAEINAATKAWNKAHPGRARAYAKKYHEAHKDDPAYKAMKIANFEKWLEANRDYWNAYNAEYARTHYAK